MPSNIEDFLRGYINAALWSSTDDNGAPLDRGHDPTDIDPEAIATAREECAQFIAANAADLAEVRDELAGFCLLMTRNRHGTGFWDRDDSEIPGADRRERLTDAAHAAGERSLYVGNDGVLRFG